MTVFENPKGMLLEFCARARTRADFEPLVSGGRFGARVLVALEGETLDSGVHWATERTQADQSAAAAILHVLATAADEDEEAPAWIPAEDATQLRQQNPKGALLEHAARARMTVTFDVAPVVSAAEGLGFEAAARAAVDGDEVWSDLYRARTAIVAEHAAARSLAARLAARREAPGDDPPHAKVEVANARAVLNEMRQRNELRELAFVVERIEGPPHASVFVMAGFAVRADGSGVDVRGVEGSTKKEGEKLAATRLLAKLRT